MTSFPVTLHDDTTTPSYGNQTAISRRPFDAYGFQQQETIGDDEWTAASSPVSPITTASCLQLEFYVYAVVVGFVCLSGFAVNTIGLLLVGKQRAGLLRCVVVDRNVAAFNIMLQLSIVADIFLLWMLFVGHVIPSLAYVIPLLSNCELTCRRLAAVYRPLSTLSQILVVSLTTATVVRGQMVVNDEVVAMTIKRRSAMEMVGSATEHSTVKMKLVAMAILLAGVIYVVPLAIDGWLPPVTSPSRDIASASDADDATMSPTLAEDRLYQVLYVDGLGLLVLVVPLVVLLGVVISLPTTASALTRIAVGDWRHRGSDSMHRLHGGLSQVAGGVSAQLDDVIRISTVLSAMLLLTYVPQVALSIAGWAGLRSSTAACLGRSAAALVAERTVSAHQGDAFMFYSLGAARLLGALNSSLKLPALCIASRQYRDCLRRIGCWCCCCNRANKGRSPAAAAETCAADETICRLRPPQRHQHRRAAGEETIEASANHSSSTGVTLMSSSSDDDDTNVLDETADSSQRPGSDVADA